MTGLSAARSVLLDLAQHLRPNAAAVLAPDDEVLVVACSNRTILVEAIATVTTSLSRAYYRNPKSLRIYGRIGEPEAAAAQILAELTEGTTHE